jgi:hypothetical protein
MRRSHRRCGPASSPASRCCSSRRRRVPAAADTHPARAAVPGQPGLTSNVPALLLGGGLRLDNLSAWNVWTPGCAPAGWAPSRSRPRCGHALCGCNSRVGVGPGVACPKRWCSGVGASRAGVRVVPRLPSRALAAAAGAQSRVADHADVERIADIAFQGAQRAPASHSLAVLPLAVDAALGAAVADLGNRGHVDGVVELPVPVPGKLVNLSGRRRRPRSGVNPRRRTQPRRSGTRSDHMQQVESAVRNGSGSVGSVGLRRAGEE